MTRRRSKTPRKTPSAAPKRSLLRYLLHGLLLSLLAVALLFAFCGWQVWRYARIEPQPSARADAAIVLGAAAWGTRPSPVFRERINHAIALYQSGRVDKLIFTGGTPKAGFMTEAEVGRRFALKQGVPAADILSEHTSKDTLHNLLNARSLMADNDLHTALIVSDPYHLARAAAIAEHLGMETLPSPTPTSRYNNSSGTAQWRFFLQESNALLGFYLLDWWHGSEPPATP